MTGRVKLGRFADFYRGDGAFASIPFRDGFLTVSLRWQWHFYTVVPQGKPRVRRIYVGPIEIEYWRAA